MNFGIETRIERYMVYKFLFTIMFVSLLSLANQASCFATTVTLQWDPNTATDLAGYKVYYQADSSTQPFQGAGATPVLIGKATTTATISGLVSSHAYYFAVTAYNTSGVESAYSNIVSVPELQPPTVTAFTLPSTYSLLTVPITTFTATDNVAVTGFCVTLTNSSSGCAWSGTAPGSVTFPSTGSQTAYAWAKDAAGNISSAVSRSLTITTDTTPPTVAITAPANNATLSGTTTITATASDTGGISKVEFYLDNSTTPFYTTNATPYSYSCSTTSVANGSHTLSVKAYDTAGNTKSASITVTVSNPTTATMSSPVNASTLTGASQTFSWNNIGANQYVVWVGSSLGNNDIVAYPAGGTTATSIALSGLPTNGKTLYVRLWSLFGSTWYYSDYTYTAAGTLTQVPAAMSTPTPASKLSGASATFNWNNASADYYVVWVGSTFGGNDIVAYPAGGTTATSIALSGLPTNGKTLYVRLWSLFGSTWYYKDYTYTAAGTLNLVPAVMSTPTPGSTITGAGATFNWNNASADYYVVWVGSTFGGNDIVAYPAGGTTATSIALSGLPTSGSTLYVRLWSLFGTTWYFNDYTYMSGP